MAPYAIRPWTPSLGMFVSPPSQLARAIRSPNPALLGRPTPSKWRPATGALCAQVGEPIYVHIPVARGPAKIVRSDQEAQRILIFPVASWSQMPRWSELTIKVNPDNGSSLRFAPDTEAKVWFGKPEFLGPAFVLFRRVSMIPSGIGFHPVGDATQPLRDPWRLVACERLPTEGPFPVPGLWATAHHVPAISLTWIIGVRELVAV